MTPQSDTTHTPVAEGQAGSADQPAMGAQADSQLMDLTVLHLKCQLLAFLVVVVVYNLYVLYMEVFGGKTRVQYFVHDGTWRWP